MTNQIFFAVEGEPVGKGRPRFARKGSFVSTYTPKKTASYEERVRNEYKKQAFNHRFPDDAPLKIEISAFYGVPKSASKAKKEEMLLGKAKPTKKPDLDNVIKIIADSLNGIAYKDDAQIIEASIRKHFSEFPRVEVKIYV